MRILIIEDSAGIRKLMAGHLSAMSADITEAADGTDGLARALSGSFDVILTDIDLPGESGLEICRRVKAEAPVPVVLVSSLSSDADIERGFEAGASAYLAKPFQGQELIQCIDGVLRKNLLRKRQTILLVDDSATIRRMVSRELTEAGFHVVTAGNGMEAMAAARQKRPDMIISDLNMPQMDGIQFCRTLKADPELHGIPFVVMSANSDAGAMRHLVQLGAAAYLIKPFSGVQATILIEKLLDAHTAVILKERERIENERQMLLATIMSLTQALDARDAYTSSHSQNVAIVAEAIAREMGLSDEDLEAVAMAGRLHDIGKIGIRDTILLKPGSLTDEEFAQIRRHPVIGHEILRPIASLGTALPAVLSHHEKFGGGGYPSGLCGEAIPLVARIVAVADVWHAVYSDRPYRPAMPREKALGIIRAEAGKGLCPQCVGVFFSLVDNNRLPVVEATPAQSTAE